MGAIEPDLPSSSQMRLKCIKSGCSTMASTRDDWRNQVSEEAVVTVTDEEQWTHMMQRHLGDLLGNEGIAFERHELDDLDFEELDVNAIHYRFHQDGTFPDHTHEYFNGR
jgi:hypothetical protein